MLVQTANFVISRINKLKLGDNAPSEYIRGLKEKSAMDAYKNKDINSDFILSKMKDTKYYKSTPITHDELLENNLIDNIVNCNI